MRYELCWGSLSLYCVINITSRTLLGLWLSWVCFAVVNCNDRQIRFHFALVTPSRWKISLVADQKRLRVIILRHCTSFPLRQHRKVELYFSLLDNTRCSNKNRSTFRNISRLSPEHDVISTHAPTLWYIFHSKVSSSFGSRFGCRRRELSPSWPPRVCVFETERERIGQEASCYYSQRASEIKTFLHKILNIQEREWESEWHILRT